MHALNIAKRYSKALLATATAQNCAGQVHEDMTALASALRGSKEFRSFIQNPTLSEQEKTAVLDQIFGRQAQALTMIFLRLLVTKNRLNILAFICTSWEQLYFQQQRILKVHVTSARPMEPSQLAALHEKISKKFDQSVVGTSDTDPALIGGFELLIGDMLYDRSFRTQLESFRRTLLTV